MKIILLPCCKANFSKFIWDASNTHQINTNHKIPLTFIFLTGKSRNNYLHSIKCVPNSFTLVKDSKTTALFFFKITYRFINST